MTPTNPNPIIADAIAALEEYQDVLAERGQYALDSPWARVSDTLASLRSLANAKGESVGLQEEIAPLWNPQRWVTQPCDKEGVSIIAERSDVPTGMTPTNGQVCFVTRRFGETKSHCEARAAFIIAAVKCAASPESPFPSQTPDLGREAVIEACAKVAKKAKIHWSSKIKSTDGNTVFHIRAAIARCIERDIRALSTAPEKGK